MTKETYKDKRSELRIQRIIKALTGRQLTRAELETELHMAKVTAVRYLAHLMAETDRRIYLCKWLTGETGTIKPVYTAGNGKDAKRPRKKSDYRRSRDYFLRSKRDPDKHEQYLKKRRAATLLKKTGCDPAAAWIHETRKLQAAQAAEKLKQ